MATGTITANVTGAIVTQPEVMKIFKVAIVPANADVTRMPLFQFRNRSPLSGGFLAGGNGAHDLGFRYQLVARVDATINISKVRACVGGLLY